MSGPERSPTTSTPSRRQLLRGAAALGSVGLGSVGIAGCLDVADLFESGSAGRDGQPSLPSVEDPPDVVYVPSHREGVEMLGTRTAGPYRLRAMVSYAHSFWILAGSTVEAVEIGDDVDAHLMVGVEDAETGTMLPVGSGLSTTVRDADGEVVDARSPWRMLSQTMGVHFGDNVPLAGDGTYEVTVELPPVGVRTTGTLAGRFQSAETTTFSFTYDQALRDRLVDGIQYVDEANRGVPGAIEPMGSARSLPVGRELPGALQGAGDGSDESDGPVLPRSHDAEIAVTVADDFLDDGNPYLLVSPRTPYNRFPLAGASMAATIRRNGETVWSDDLRATLDGDAGFHYGASIPALTDGDRCSIAFETPPNMARHAGYETAFLEMEPVEIELEGW